MTRVHRLTLRVYYEDTDMAGIVYYANYLRYLERGRSEMVRDAGIDQMAMRSAGVVFAVRRVVADYVRPARFGDDLTVQTAMGRTTPARFVMDQRVLRGDDLLLTAAVTIVCMDLDGRPRRLPTDVLRLADPPGRSAAEP